MARRASVLPHGMTHPGMAALNEPLMHVRPGGRQAHEQMVGNPHSRPRRRHPVPARLPQRSLAGRQSHAHAKWAMIVMLLARRARPSDCARHFARLPAAAAQSRRPRHASGGRACLDGCTGLAVLGLVCFVLARRPARPAAAAARARARNARHPFALLSHPGRCRGAAERMALVHSPRRVPSRAEWLHCWQRRAARKRRPGMGATRAPARHSSRFVVSFRSFRPVRSPALVWWAFIACHVVRIRT